MKTLNAFCHRWIDVLLLLSALLIVACGMPALLIVACGMPAQAQNLSSVPTVLGCSDPAPAVSGKPTVFFATCKTTAFVPVTSSSLVGTVSKVTPTWAHSFSYYLSNAALTPVVACPKGANITAGQCSDTAGKDVSVIVAASAVASLVLTPTPPPAPIPLDYSVSVVGADPPVGAVFKQLDSTQSQCFVVSNGLRSQQVCL